MYTEEGSIEMPGQRDRDLRIREAGEEEKAFVGSMIKDLPALSHGRKNDRPSVRIRVRKK